MREKNDDCALKADDGREKRTKKTRIAKKEPQERKGETTFIIRSLSSLVSGSVFLSLAFSFSFSVDGAFNN